MDLTSRPLEGHNRCNAFIACYKHLRGQGGKIWTKLAIQNLWMAPYCLGSTIISSKIFLMLVRHVEYCPALKFLPDLRFDENRFASFRKTLKKFDSFKIRQILGNTFRQSYGPPLYRLYTRLMVNNPSLYD